MVKSELVKKLAHRYPYVLHQDLDKIVEVIFFEISTALTRGDSIEIRGFGTYKIVNRKARMGRNPKSTKIIQIPAKKAIKWKMSKILFNRLNNNFTENSISDKY